jgi:UDP-N-acetylglucosamine--N-acetylmuramyl-(pentapeptide) pyrophosphoryl-undecaprenol N-acetylglucosamine transferase
MNENKRVFVFTGGGTGGHIYPGLAVAEQLRLIAGKNGIDISIYWFGNSSGMDRQLVEKSGICDRFYGIPSGKLRRYFSLRTIVDVFKIFSGFIVSFICLLRIRPCAVFSKGGFVSVPPCMSARILGIPVFTHECDFTPGLATKLNSRSASRLFVSYEETKLYLSPAQVKKTVVTGNPVRSVFSHAAPERGKQFAGISGTTGQAEKPVLLVLGGSLGAHQINVLVHDSLDWLCSHFTVIHQTGARDSTMTLTGHPGYHPYSFIYNEMPDVIAAADIVLSRAGANSLWECASLGKPLVLIPLEGAGTRGDQVDNARFFERSGAAVVLSGSAVDSEHLIQTLSRLENADTRHELSRHCCALVPDVPPAERIALLVFEGIKK